MNISIKDLKTDRQWRSATGYNKKRFTNLLNLFEREHLRIFGKTLSDRRSDSPKESAVETEEYLLFLTLLGLKSNLTHDLLGLMVGMDGSSAFRNKDLGISILKSMLYQRGFSPARAFESVEEFEEYFREYDTLIIDGEEQSIQRPSEEDSQKENYSGKKKAHFENNDHNGDK